ncbi:MAG: GDSL-type esterase/lipase family protein [Verrucomicrobiota bacterium]
MKFSLPVFVLSLFSSFLFAEEAKKAPEKWEPDIARFEARDLESPPVKDAWLFVGSSSIRKWDLTSSWPDQETINNGFGGSTLADSIHFFDRLFLPYQPEVILIYAGDNDINRGLTAKEVAKDFETLAASISASFPGVPIVFLAIKPSEKRWELWPKMRHANELVAEKCALKENWFFADTATPMLEGSESAPDSSWFVEDGLHLSDEGYSEWTQIVNMTLREAGIIP